MKSTALWALIILNAALLLSFIWRVMPENTAIAQRAAGGARPGDYIMVPVVVTGGNSGIVVVVDQTNAQLSAFSYDDANHRIGTMQKLDLKKLFDGGPARRGAARGY